MVLTFGAVVYEGSIQGMREVLAFVIQKLNLINMLVRSKKLWLYQLSLSNKIASFLIQPKPVYYIDTMMNFIPNCNGYVTVQQVMQVLAKTWNKSEYPTWYDAPKDERLLPKIFLDLYYHYNLNTSMPRLAEEVRRMKRPRL